MLLSAIQRSYRGNTAFMGGVALEHRKSTQEVPRKYPGSTRARAIPGTPARYFFCNSCSFRSRFRGFGSLWFGRNRPGVFQNLLIFTHPQKRKKHTIPPQIRQAGDRWQRMHQASASRRDANERRTTNRQQAEEVARQHNHDRGRRVELCRAQPSAEMQLMPHDMTPSIVPQRISSAAPGGSWPRACGDHLER